MVLQERISGLLFCLLGRCIRRKWFVHLQQFCHRMHHPYGLSWFSSPLSHFIGILSFLYGRIVIKNLRYSTTNPQYALRIRRLNQRYVSILFKIRARITKVNSVPNPKKPDSRSACGWLYHFCKSVLRSKRSDFLKRRRHQLSRRPANWS